MLLLVRTTSFVLLAVMDGRNTGGDKERCGDVSAPLFIILLLLGADLLLFVLLLKSISLRDGVFVLGDLLLGFSDYN